MFLTLIKEFSIIFFSIILNSLIKLLNYFVLIGLKNSNPLNGNYFLFIKI